MFTEEDSPDYAPCNGCDAVCHRINGKVRSSRATSCAGFVTNGSEGRTCFDCHYGAYLTADADAPAVFRPTVMMDIEGIAAFVFEGE